MADALVKDLPRYLPSFLARFRTDAQCRAYLVEACWPNSCRCAGCGHDRACSQHRRLIEECRACGKQHSILAGTLFDQSKTGLARQFLAIYLVTSGKGRISALELQRQMGFRSYGTPPPRACCTRFLSESDHSSPDDRWTWLHKIHRAMVDPDRRQLKGTSTPTRPSSTELCPARPAAVPPARPSSPARSRPRGVRPRSASLAGCGSSLSPRQRARILSGSSPQTSRALRDNDRRMARLWRARDRRLRPPRHRPRALVGRG
jgi:hypothetical protein